MTKILKLVHLIEDESFLQAIRVLLIKQIPNADSRDFWDELPIHLQQDIETALMEADNGELLSHEVVMQEMREIVYKSMKVNSKPARPLNVSPNWQVSCP